MAFTAIQLNNSKQIAFKRCINEIPNVGPFEGHRNSMIKTLILHQSFRIDA